MSEVTIETRAYAKMILHAMKYPHCAVNGVLLSDPKKDLTKDTNLNVVNSIPLFHHSHYVTPMAEIAMLQIEAAAQAAGLVISGYYACSENFQQNTIDKCPGQKLAEKIAENHPYAYFFLMDNEKLIYSEDTPALTVYQHVDGKWKHKDDTLVHYLDISLLNIVSDLITRGVYKELVDFDNHLDDLTLDWSNAGLDKLITTVSGPAESRLRRLLLEEDEDDEEDESNGDQDE